MGAAQGIVEGDDAAWAGVALNILKNVVSVEALGIIARNKIPHHQFVVAF